MQSLEEIHRSYENARREREFRKNLSIIGMIILAIVAIFVILLVLDEVVVDEVLRKIILWTALCLVWILCPTGLVIAWKTFRIIYPSQEEQPPISSGNPSPSGKSDYPMYKGWKKSESDFSNGSNEPFFYSQKPCSLISSNIWIHHCLWSFPFFKT